VCDRFRLLSRVPLLTLLAGLLAAGPARALPGNVLSSQKLSDIAGNFTPILDNGDEFGESVADLGDLDGAGPAVKAMAIGVALDDDGTSGIDRGAVYITFLAANGTVTSSTKISDAVNFPGFPTGRRGLVRRLGRIPRRPGWVRPERRGDRGGSARRRRRVSQCRRRLHPVPVRERAPCSRCRRSATRSISPAPRSCRSMSSAAPSPISATSTARARARGRSRWGPSVTTPVAPTRAPSTSCS
jgi:hypothetical protein